MSMRRTIILAASLLLAGIVNAQDPQTAQTTQQNSQTSDSVAAAARKAREQKKPQATPAKTYTNEDVQSLSGGISTVGADVNEKKTEEKASPNATETKTTAADKKDEKYWRKRFADLRQKIASTQAELDVLQRELNVAQKQFYPDPNAALQQQYSRDEINKKTEQIDAKKKELEDLNQQMTALEDELRRAGGDPGWAR